MDLHERNEINMKVAGIYKKVKFQENSNKNQDLAI